MSNETDICNLALAALGDEATVVSIDPPEGSAQADHCAQWYPVARDALLEMHDWKFASRRIVGTPMAAVSTSTWQYAYAKPSGALRIRAVLPPGAPDDAEDPPAFDVETLEDGTEVIVTDQAEAVIRYTVRTVDVGRFPPLFVQALVRLLASYLAGPVLKGDTGRAESRAQLQMAMSWLGQASASDANQRHRTGQFTPAHLAARGGYMGMRR